MENMFIQEQWIIDSLNKSKTEREEILMQECRQIAAGCWCQLSTEKFEMIPELAEEFAKILFNEKLPYLKIQI